MGEDGKPVYMEGPERIPKVHSGAFSPCGFASDQDFLVPGDVVLEEPVWGCWLPTYPHGCTKSINLTSLSSQTHGRKEVYLNAKGIGDIGAKLVGNELKKNTDCLSLLYPTPTPSSCAWLDYQIVW